MVLYLVGTGLNDEKGMTLGGIELMKTAEKVYLESYTSILSKRADLMKFTNGKSLIEADRKMIEEHCDEIIEEAREKSIVILVVGDPFCATTHSDLVLRAYEKGVKVEVLHNASIISAIGCTGLQVYRFGETVSIPFFDGNWRPSSFYDKIKANLERGLHTLCLLDIKVKEQTIENMMKNRPIFEPPRFMTVNQAISQLLILEDQLKQHVVSPNSIAIGVARIGSSDQMIVSGTFSELFDIDFGNPLHSLVICHPDLHLIEQRFFELYKKK
ncbi:diphthine synthase and diphthamide biosynthesis methyltransferase [Cryptosporidium canis]|uniref:diphthine methyl ester synthase n=1 Tax=Cryptosporidium canis TaxID=195482 RepID=A0A9D5DH61_9CRYT|nr:diphthine synthase and diphthamide biosynthesis methyltransferase [Cryptosporidium canis]